MIMAGGAIAGIAMVVGAIASALINNEQQKKASKEQYERQRALSRQNQAMAVENWKNTNAAAQRKEYEKAGLSVGMMYSGGGGQGLGVTPQGNISKRDVSEIDLQSPVGAAIQGKQLDLQQKQQEANIENVQADTRKKNIEADQMGGIDLQTKAATLENLKQQTENKVIEGAIMRYETEMKKVEANIANETERDIIYQAKAAGSKMMDEARSAYAQANVDQKTQDERIKQIEQTTKEQAMRMIIMKLSGDKLVMETEETAQKISQITGEIEKLVKETENVDARTANEKQKLILDRIANEFMYGDEAKAIRAFTAAKQVMGFWGPKQEKFVPRGKR